jgi:hypothetical protein
MVDYEDGIAQKGMIAVAHKEWGQPLWPTSNFRLESFEGHVIS